LFERAIGRDPNYALAWTGIAISFTEMGEGGMMPPDEAYPRARAAVERALLLIALGGNSKLAGDPRYITLLNSWECLLHLSGRYSRHRQPPRRN